MPKNKCAGKTYFEVIDGQLKKARLPWLVLGGLPPVRQRPREDVAKVLGDDALPPLPPDPRVQETNQAARCFRTFMDFLDCRYYLAEDDSNCVFLKQTYSRICPSFWTEKWFEQLEKGTHPAWSEPPPVTEPCYICP